MRVGRRRHITLEDSAVPLTRARLRRAPGRGVLALVLLGLLAAPASARAPRAPRADSLKTRAAAPDSLRAIRALGRKVRRSAPDSLRTRRADSLSVQWEFGASSEISNELFYEEIYTDTTFLGRRLHGTPQYRLAGVAAAEITSARRDGRRSWTLRPEVAIGNQLTRAGAAGTLRLRPDPRWRLMLEPRAEYTRDLGFGVERRELQAGATALARRLLDDGVNSADLRLSGDLLATPRSADPYLLAHRVGGFTAGWAHAALTGWDWTSQLGTQFRTFPDSVARHHAEMIAEGSLRRDFESGPSLALGAELARRVTLYPEVSSRDRFLNLQTQASASWRIGERHALRASWELEGWWYDVPDSSVDFDYTVDRVLVTFRRELADGFTLALGPRGELLSSGWNREERYREIAGVAELELLSGRRWWLVQPAAGWRAYEASAAGIADATTALHSSFAFAELQVFGDQSLPGKLRARVLLNGRLERHQDDSQNSRSLYFSLDLRRLF